MPNTEPRRQAANTIGVLAAILANPKVRLKHLASTFGMSEAHIAKLLTIYREAGIDLRYDRELGQYVGKLSKSLGDWILSDVKTKLAESLKQDIEHRVAPTLASDRPTYTLEEFADKVLTTTTAGHVYNMALGWNGATMPEGWAAYQIKERGKWFITKADYDKRAGAYTLPSDLGHPHRYNVGQRPAAASAEIETCNEIDNGEPCGRTDIAALGKCQKHYAAERRRKRAASARRHKKSKQKT